MNYKQPKFILSISAVLICAAISAVLLCSCKFLSIEKEYTQNGLFFDTIITITIYDTDKNRANNCLNEAINLCQKYENLFSASISSSDIHKINTSKGAAVKVSDSTAKLLKTGLYYSSLSDGLFDISISPATNLWDFHGDKNEIPDLALLNEALTHVNYKNINLADDNTVILSDKKSQIEVGGLAKGYIADCIADYLLSQNVNNAIINMGGDIKVIGSPTGKSYFTIGINNPDKGGKPLFPVYLSNTSIATSGTYERSFIKDGILYHHILDPKTGYPCQTDLKQATVITKDSIAADALATICILKGASEAENFIESLDNTEAILITDKGDKIFTRGMHRYTTISE